MQFEWNENKNKANIEKHGIAFEDATKVFFSKRIEKQSDHVNEKHYVTIGEVSGRVIAVIYTMRGENIRIISARKARKNEERKYRSA